MADDLALAVDHMRRRSDFRDDCAIAAMEALITKDNAIGHNLDGFVRLAFDYAEAMAREYDRRYPFTVIREGSDE